MPPCVGRFHRPNSSRCFLDIQRLPALGPCLTWLKACRGTISPPSSTWWPTSCGSGRSSTSRAWQTDWTSSPTSSVTFCCDPPGNKSCKLPMAASVYRSENLCLACRKSDTENRSLTWSDLWIISVLCIWTIEEYLTLKYNYDERDRGSEEMK